MKHWFLSLRTGLEMASEFKEFLTTLEPVWEDPHEFDWLRTEDIEIKKERKNLLELNRFPGLKMAMGY